LDAIYKNRYAEWTDLEKAIEVIPDNKQKGDAFEEFVYFYLLYNKDFYQIRDIYFPVAQKKRFPIDILRKLKLENKDHGVDGVYTNHDGKLVSIQAKFRSDRSSPPYKELSTFWTEAEYSDYRMIVSNAQSLIKVSGKKSGHLEILRDHFDKLDGSFFEALYKFALNLRKPILKQRKKPREYQEEIIKDIVNGFSKSKRGKLIAACGIGKTLIALWVVERLGEHIILFLAPSLQLIRQTLEEWSAEASEQFEYLCICSDKTVDISDEDLPEIALSELDIPVTTDVEIITNFLKKVRTHRRIIFSTYQSVPVLANALKSLPGVLFDQVIYDEAHRTAGISSSNLFSQALLDSEIPSRRRLFMTATERLVKPRIRGIAEEANEVIFSMDDEESYGRVFHRLSFGKAIRQGIVSDYRIVFAGITESELGKLIARNRYIAPVVSGISQSNIEAAQQLYKRILLKRGFIELGVKKVISYHPRVTEANYFSVKMIGELEGLLTGNIVVEHINGAMPTSVRSDLIKNFKRADYGVLTNVRCLTEGVDIPLIDGIFFANQKGSLIDIVQAVGRALRQPFGEKGKMAYIIIPVLVDDTSGEPLSGEGFETIYNIIQAMRDQDETLAEWIDKLNLGAVTGRTSKIGRTPGKVQIIMPSGFDVDSFESALFLKIGEVNKDPTGHIGIGGKLGKKERTSSYTRLFKTMCDYRPDILYSNLVEPTLKIIKPSVKTYPGNNLKINHNNVSHCERLGLIRKIDSKNYEVTPFGVLLKNNRINFNDLFKNQMLLYLYKTGKGILYPYRAAFIFMREVKVMGYIDFLYGIYSLQIGTDIDNGLAHVIKIAKIIQKTYPNIEMTNEANKAKILDELNNLHPVGFPYNDVWTDRTTTGNQYRYLLRHLELFTDLFRFNDKRLYLIDGAEEQIDTYLDKTADLCIPENHVKNYGSIRWI